MLDDTTSHIAILLVELHIPAAQSLKDKRRVIKSLKDRIRSRHNVSIAELGELDKWQYAVCGIAMIGNEQKFLDQTIQSILDFIESQPEILSMNKRLEFL